MITEGALVTWTPAFIRNHPGTRAGQVGIVEVVPAKGLLTVAWEARDGGTYRLFTPKSGIKIVR